MIRIIVRTQYHGAAAHIPGAKTEYEFKTFDVDFAEIEKYLRETLSMASREVIGVELLEADHER